MSYQVLARKWRPRDFSTLVGQEHVVKALTHALEQNRLHHAWLFTGTRGVGKTTLSRILAKALNCTGADGNGGITAQPCGVCRACTEIDAGRFVDYIEMDAASNRGVDEMAQLLDKAIYGPGTGRFKVYMIDEVHMLTNHAFNAMLKTLEEPPEHVKFILATTDPQKIPVTVLSRCLQFNLKQMPPGHIVGYLESILGQEKIDFEPNALRLLAKAASGSMRDALSLTDQAIAYSAGQVSEEAVRGMLGALDQSYLVRLLDALAADEGAALLAIADEMAERSLSFSAALQDLGSLLHKIALAQAVPQAVSDDWPEAVEVRRLAGVFDAQEAQLFYQIANQGRAELALAPDEYAGFTMALLRMLAFRPANLPSAGESGGGAATGPRNAGGTGRSGSAPDNPSGRRTESPADTGRTTAAAVHSPIAAESMTPPAAKPVAATVPALPAAKEPPPRSLSPAMAALAAMRNGRGGDAQGGTNPSAHAPTPAAVQPRPTRVAPAPAVVPASATAASRPGGEAGVAALMPRTVPGPAAQAPRMSLDQANLAAAAYAADDGMEIAYLDLPPWEDAQPATGPTARDASNEPSSAPPAVPSRAASAASAMAAARGSRPRPNDEPVAVEAPVTTVLKAAEPASQRAPRPEAAALNGLVFDGFDGDWPALAARLPLRGLVQQLAFQTELIGVDAQGEGAAPLRLILRAPMRQMTEGGATERLEQALNEAFGRTVTLAFEFGSVQFTAAIADAETRAERQRECEAAVHSDPFVQSLMREFGGTIVPGSIRPL